MFLTATNIAKVYLWCRGEDHVALRSLGHRTEATMLELFQRLPAMLIPDNLNRKWERDRCLEGRGTPTTDKGVAENAAVGGRE